MQFVYYIIGAALVIYSIFAIIRHIKRRDCEGCNKSCKNSQCNKRDRLK